jgi:hypothetical protein
MAFPWTSAQILPRFFFATPNRHDPDNLTASLKAAFDGLRDARIIADDNRLTHLPPEIAVDRKRPRVELVITFEEGPEHATRRAKHVPDGPGATQPPHAHPGVAGAKVPRARDGRQGRAAPGRGGES